MSQPRGTYSYTPGRDEEPGLLARWKAGALRLDEELKTSLPHDQPGDEKTIQAWFESEFDRPQMWAGKIFQVSDYICGVVSVAESEQGESILGVRTLLLGPGQMPIRFTSKDILDFLRATSKKIGQAGPWDPPLQVKLTVSKRGQVVKYGFRLVNEKDYRK